MCVCVCDCHGEVKRNAFVTDPIPLCVSRSLSPRVCVCMCARVCPFSPSPAARDTRSRSRCRRERSPRHALCNVAVISHSHYWTVLVSVACLPFSFTRGFIFRIRENITTEVTVPRVYISSGAVLFLSFLFFVANKLVLINTWCYGYLAGFT